jgi:hypothetical protein
LSCDIVMLDVSKAWLIGYANHRIRHINLYRNASSIESLATQLLAMKDEEDNPRKNRLV